MHRDIKPDNICIGLGSKSKTLYLIDMAFCKRYINKDGSHIAQQEGKMFTGTARYASVMLYRLWFQFFITKFIANESLTDERILK